MEKLRTTWKHPKSTILLIGFVLYCLFIEKKLFFGNHNDIEWNWSNKLKREFAVHWKIVVFVYTIVICKLCEFSMEITDQFARKNLKILHLAIFVICIMLCASCEWWWMINVPSWLAWQILAPIFCVLLHKNWIQVDEIHSNWELQLKFWTQITNICAFLSCKCKYITKYVALNDANLL